MDTELVRQSLMHRQVLECHPGWKEDGRPRSVNERSFSRHDETAIEIEIYTTRERTRRPSLNESDSEEGGNLRERRRNEKGSTEVYSMERGNVQ